MSRNFQEVWHLKFASILLPPSPDAREFEQLCQLMFGSFLVPSSTVVADESQERTKTSLTNRPEEPQPRQTDWSYHDPDKPTGATTTPASWTELPQPRQTSLTGKSTSTNNSAFKAKKRRSPYKQVETACETTTTTCLPLPLDQLLLILWGSIFPKIQFTTSYDAGAKAIHLTWISIEACVWLCHHPLFSWAGWWAGPATWMFYF